MLNTLTTTVLAILAITPSTLGQGFVSGGETTTAAPCIPTYTHTIGSTTSYTTITKTQPRPFVWTSTPVGYCGFTDPSPTPPNFALSTQTETTTCASTTLTTGVDVLTGTVISYICPRSPCTMTREASGPCPTPTATSTGGPANGVISSGSVSTSTATIVSDPNVPSVSSTILGSSSSGKSLSGTVMSTKMFTPTTVTIGSVPIVITNDATFSILPFGVGSFSTSASSETSTALSGAPTTASVLASTTMSGAAGSTSGTIATAAVTNVTMYIAGNAARSLEMGWWGCAVLVGALGIAWLA